MGHIVVCEAAFNWGGEIVCAVSFLRKMFKISVT
jgi:hypothetical protein